MIKIFKEAVKYEIDVTSVDPHNVTNQRYFTGKGISSDPKDAKLYDSEEDARADFKKVPKKFNGALIRDARVAKRFVKESKKLSEGKKFDSSKFKKNCLIAEKAIDEIIDDNYDNVDDLTDGEATFIRNHFGSIIIRCKKFLDDFGLTESKVKGFSGRKLKESKFREFSKTDWYSYQGASNFEDGSSPLIGEFCDGDITIIISGGDNNGGKSFIELDFYNEETEDSMTFGRTYKSKDRALSVANKMASELKHWNYNDDIEEDVEDFADDYGLKRMI